MANRTAKTPSQPTTASPLPSTKDAVAIALLVGRKSLIPLADRLSNARWQFTYASSMMEAVRTLQDQAVDVVFAPASKRGLKVLQDLRARVTIPPLLVALTTDSEFCSDCEMIDLVLAQTDPNLLTNVLHSIALVRRARAAKPQNQPASTEIELMKTMIVKTVSHELRTPLLQVKSAIALLGESDNDRERLLGYATESAARLESVVLNITRLAESLDIELEPVLPSEAISYAMRQLRRSWDARGKADRVSIQVPEHALPVIADRHALGVALQLLLDNALKFSQDQVRLVVTPLEVDEIEFRITDTGIGIPPEQLDRIFEPFYQVDQVSARRFGGSGVGLAIVRLILERHSTAVQVESRPSEGSSFFFRLPTVPGGELPY